ncbi:MAG: hypothetical protein R2843_08595 [Thermomicrobiales bacterium]
MGKYIDSMEVLQKRFNATVVGLHHLNKTGTMRGIRGRVRRRRYAIDRRYDSGGILSLTLGKKTMHKTQQSNWSRISSNSRLDRPDLVDDDENGAGTSNTTLVYTRFESVVWNRDPATGESRLTIRTRGKDNHQERILKAPTTGRIRFKSARA